VIGYEESSQLDFEPARYFVQVTKREKRACKSCEEQGVVSAPLPPRIIDPLLLMTARQKPYFSALGKGGTPP
jgi:transposase